MGLPLWSISLPPRLPQIAVKLSRWCVSLYRLNKTATRARQRLNLWCEWLVLWKNLKPNGIYDGRREKRRSLSCDRLLLCCIQENRQQLVPMEKSCICLYVMTYCLPKGEGGCFSASSLSHLLFTLSLFSPPSSPSFRRR